MGAVTKTSTFSSFNAYEASLIDSKAINPASLDSCPNMSSSSCRVKLNTLSFVLLYFFMSLSKNKLVVKLKYDFCFSKILIGAKIIGIKKSNILLSSNIFKIISIPIPFGSPIEIPSLTFLDI